MSNDQSNPNSNPTQTTQAAEIPVAVGGRVVTGFSAAGVSVQIAASQKEELEAELLARQIAACNRGMRFFSVYNPGRTQLPPPSGGRI